MEELLIQLDEFKEMVPLAGDRLRLKKYMKEDFCSTNPTSCTEHSQLSETGSESDVSSGTEANLESGDSKTIDNESEATQTNTKQGRSFCFTLSISLKLICITAAYILCITFCPSLLPVYASFIALDLLLLRHTVFRA